MDAPGDTRLPRFLQLIIPALTLVVAAIALGSIGPVSPHLTTLDGPWDARIEEPGQPPRTGTIELPGRFGIQGIDPDARVRATRTVTLPPHAEPWALHLEVPLHAAAVRWDGQEIGRSGDPERAGPDAHRSNRPVLAMIPADPEGRPHELELDVRGDYRKGGLTGRIRLGPVAELAPALLQDMGARLGFAIAFLVVSLLHLLGALRHRGRPSELYFGLAALCIAAYAYHHASTTVAAELSPWHSHLMRRVLVAGMITFPVWFAGSFVLGRLTRAHHLWGTAAALTALVSPLGPQVSTRMENLQDVMVLATIAWVGGLTVVGYRRGVSGSAWFTAAVLIGMVGALSEIAVTNGLVTGVRWLYPALAVFLLFGSLAVVAQDRTLSARHLRLVQGNADAMVELTTGGVVLQVNPAARSFLPGLAEGNRLHDVLPSQLGPLLTAHLARAKQKANRLELRLLDGRVVESVATTLDPDTLLLVLRDVTRRRQAEDDLVQAARLETAGMLAGGVAHDFNNLLGTLLGHIGLLRMKSADPDTIHRLDRMEQTVERASLVTRRLLAVGGRSENAPLDVDAEVVIDEAVEIAEPAMPEGIELDVAVDGPLPTVRVSDEDLRHILLNLILNARDAMNGTGRIDITAEADDDGGVRICVADDGPGVPDELRERIFQPFFTTKGSDKGTGLGLPMARRLIRRHGGSLHLEDAAGGAMFVLHLQPADGTPVRVRHALGASVAVVDDEPALCAAYAAAIEAAGYQVTTYPDGQEALAALATRPPHVLVTDVVMPGMSGLELAADLRELYPNLPVLVVSGFVPTSERSLGGPTEHLDKPIRPVRIVEAIGRLLGSIDGEPPVPSRPPASDPAPGRLQDRV